MIKDNKEKYCLNKVINRNELKELQTLNPSILIKDTIFSWVIIFSSICISYFNKNNLLINCIFSIIVGTQFYSLLILGHDGIHRNGFRSVRQNDFWNDFFILGLFGAITRINRLNHINHHLLLSTAKDPDRYKYESKTRKNKINFLINLSCIPLLIKSFFNIYISPLRLKLFKLKRNNIDNKNKIFNKKKYYLRDILLLSSWQIIIVFGLLSFFGIKGYLLFYIFPFMFASACDLIRVFCEHSRASNDKKADESLRLSSIYPNLIEKIFLAPHNMNLHAAHHLWPSIPYYNLVKADKLLRSRISNKYNKIIWYKSYLGIIYRFFKYAK